MKSSRIGRIVKILTVLQSATPCDADSLADMLKTSRRTIFRDFKELQGIGVSHRYDFNKGSYTLEEGFFLPPTNLTLQEALSLLLLVHKSAKRLQVPFAKSVFFAGMKTENNLPVNIRKYCGTVLSNISTKASAHAPMSHFDKIFALLLKALNSRNRVLIQYNSLFEGKTLALELCPYHLMFNQRAWYVLGLSSLHKSVRTFKLNRIKELKISGKRFAVNTKFDLDEYLGRAWSMIPEGKMYNIKLRFTPKVSQNVAEVRWHSTQKVARHSDGSATLEFRVDGLGEISWWILGYGDQVRVLAPEALRKRIIQSAKNVIAHNEISH